MIFMWPIWWWLHGVMVGIMLTKRRKHHHADEKLERVDHTRVDEKLERVIEKNRHRLLIHKSLS